MSKLAMQSMPRKVTKLGNCCWGHRNKHKQRRIPSSIRTPGRLARHAYRMLSTQDSPVMVPTHPVLRAHFESITPQANKLFDQRAANDPNGWLTILGGVR